MYLDQKTNHFSTLSGLDIQWRFFIHPFDFIQYLNTRLMRVNWVIKQFVKLIILCGWLNQSFKFTYFLYTAVHEQNIIIQRNTLKVRAHLTTIHWKALDCSQARRLRQQVANYFHKHHGRLFGRNFVDDCPLFWFAAVSAVCKQCIVLTLCVTVYLLLIHPCK